MGKVVRLADGQTECDEPVQCPFFVVCSTTDIAECSLSDREVKFVDGKRLVHPKGRYERPAWCELPATVWVG